MNKGIMLNIDDTHFLYSRSGKGIEVTEAEVRRFVRQYEGTQVTDLIFSCAGRIICYPSKVSTNWLDKYRQKEENGRPVDYSGTYARLAHEMYEVRGIDPYALWLQECRDIGVRGWLSLRMNDCHDNDLETSVLHPDFYHEHPEYRRVTHRPVDGYFDRCFDYAEEAVRQRELALIDELLERYDMDGIELDWQREAFCFRPGAEWEGIEIINEFTREVSRRVKAAAEKRGHEILLSARVPADPEHALEMGFDAAQWAREGLVQVIIPTPRWRTCDCDIPVPMWKRLLAGTGTEIAPGIEILLQPGRCRRFYASTDQVTGLAAQHFALGGDKTYLFNYFDDPDPEDSYWPEGGVGHPDMGVKWAHQQILLRTIGDPDKVRLALRSHMVTERDLMPEWRITERVLPFICEEAHKYKQVRVCVGDIPAEAKVTLTLGLAAGRAEDLAVYANRRPARLLGEAEVRPAYFDHAAFAFEVENDGRLPVYLLLEIAMTGDPVEIDYIEVHVE